MAFIKTTRAADAKGSVLEMYERRKALGDTYPITRRCFATVQKSWPVGADYWREFADRLIPGFLSS